MNIIKSIAILIILIISVKSIDIEKYQQDKEMAFPSSSSEFIPSYGNIPIYFSILPFDKGNYSCSFGGFYGLGFFGQIDQCVVDPQNEEYNYKILLEADDSIEFVLYNKTDITCEGYMPYTNTRYAIREGVCQNVPNFIGLKDALSGHGDNGYHYLYDEAAFATISPDKPYKTPNSVIFGSYNHSNCNDGQDFPKYAKTISVGMEFTTAEGSTYYYSCQEYSNWPQITNCVGTKCETTVLDYNCSPVEGTDNAWQQIYCQ